MDDIALTNDVLEEPVFEPSVNAALIGVAVSHGVATSSGHVGSFADKAAVKRAVGMAGGRVPPDGEVHSLQERTAAQRAAWTAPGVHVVEDRIKIE